MPWRRVLVDKLIVPYKCPALCGPGGEIIVDIVPGATELELQLSRGVGAGRTRNNPHVKCTGVY